jgi:hypothetical protein
LSFIFVHVLSPKQSEDVAGCGCSILVFAVVAIAIVGMFQCAGDALEKKTREAESKEFDRLNRDHPDHSCRNELANLREGDDSLVVELRDTVPGVPFRDWTEQVRRSDGLHSVKVWWPTKLTMLEKDYGYLYCQSEMVVDIYENGNGRSFSDSLADRYADLLTRAGRTLPTFLLERGYAAEGSTLTQPADSVVSPMTDSAVPELHDSTAPQSDDSISSPATDSSVLQRADSLVPKPD